MDTRYLRISDALIYLCVSRTHFWKLRKSDPAFPKPSEIGGVPIWDRLELDAYLASQKVAA